MKEHSFHRLSLRCMWCGAHAHAVFEATAPKTCHGKTRTRETLDLRGNEPRFICEVISAANHEGK